MKHILIFLVSFLQVAVCAAQYKGRTATSTNSSAGPKLAARTTAIKQRLTGQSLYALPDNVVSDSFTFRYMRPGGSYFDPEQMTYTPHQVNAGFSHSDEITGYILQTGLAKPRNMAPYVSCDTAHVMTHLPGGGYGVLATESRSYDAAGNLTCNEYVAHPDHYSVKNEMTYNSANDLVSAITYEWNEVVSPAEWRPRFYSVISYSSDGKMTMDSQSIYQPTLSSWTPLRKYTYSYDAAGNMVLATKWDWASPLWEQASTYVMTHMPDGRLHTYRCYAHTAGGVGLRFFDSLGYTAGAGYATYSLLKSYIVSGGHQVTVKNVNAFGMPDTVYSYGGADSMTTTWTDMQVVTYNSYNNPAAIDYYFDNGSVAPTTLYARALFYYELYDTNSLPVLPDGVADVLVYPNPAADEISLLVQGTGLRGPLTVAISDLAGRVVSKKTADASGGTMKLPVAGLSQGMYIVSVRQAGIVVARKPVQKL